MEPADVDPDERLLLANVEDWLDPELGTASRASIAAAIFPPVVSLTRSIAASRMSLALALATKVDPENRTII
ncbi:MAG: hypothetical protein ABL925_18060 [Methylococcales bacterium]